MLKILHAGDLHLGSALSAFSSRAAAMRRTRQLAAFEAMLKEGVSRGASLVLLAGDSFDTVHPDHNTTERFFAALAAIAVPVVIVTGNHDYYTVGGFWDSVTLPPNVTLIKGTSLEEVDFPALGVTVFGYSFGGESAVAPAITPRVREGRISLLLAHSDITSPLSTYAPLVAGQFEASPFTYAALGHIHKPIAPCRYGNTVVAYSGFLCGRGFDETGRGHANLVEISEHDVRVLPIESEADTFEILTVDCTGASSGEALRQMLREALERAELPNETALRAVLVGEVGAACHIDEAALLALGEKYALFEIKDKTLPLFDSDLLAKDPGLRGALYRALLPRLSSPDEVTRAVATEALRMGLAALSGREV